MKNTITTLKQLLLVQWPVCLASNVVRIDFESKANKCWHSKLRQTCSTQLSEIVTTTLLVKLTGHCTSTLMVCNEYF